MATHGLRIINDESELLIDSEYFSPAFVEKLEFGVAPTETEAPTGQLHPGYIKRTYTTPAITAPGNFIVMWTLPDNASNDIWYSFETSTSTIMGALNCYVFANSTGASLTYSLPTAYLFTTDTLPAASETYGLRLFNASGVKTFDSNNVQLAPYSISDAFAFAVSGASETTYGATPVSININMPTSPIFMLPDFTALRVKKDGQRHFEYVYESAFKRIGSSLSTRLLTTYYSPEDSAWPSTTTIYTTGKTTDVSVIVADANLYQAAGGGSGGGGANPTYTLTSNFSSRDEGTTVVVTLTTTLVTNNTQFPYTVTGISAADLSAGGITGSFIVNNNTASATFTFANDYYTDGAEIFTLSLDGLTQYISVTVNDTSLTPSYSWSTPGNVNEGATGYTTFNATNANGKIVAFDVWSPLAGISISGSSDGALLTSSWTVSGNAATSINVQYSAVADAATEGPETFRIRAVVDGAAYFSDDITVNDTSKAAGYSLASADNWNESNSYPVTVSANNVNGTTLYLTTDNTLVTPSSSSVSVTSNSFTSNVSFTAGIATANATVRISLRTGSTNGTEVAFKEITLVNVTPSYSFGAASAFSEGANGSIQFNYSYAANKTVAFSVVAPSIGKSGVSDVTLTTTSLVIGATNASGNTSVTYSAVADSTTEGAEYFRIAGTVDGIIYYSTDITISDASLYPVSGTAIGSPSCVPGTTTLRQVRADGVGGTYNDDTLNSPTCGYIAPAYSFTRSATSVSEGGSFTITLNTNQTGSFGYTITGVTPADIDGASLTGSLSNAGVLTVSVSADQATEGTDTFTITLDNGFATTSVSIGDTSLYPASGTVISEGCLAYGTSPYTYRVTKANGTGGSTNTDTDNSISCGYVAPTYSFTRSATSVSEGSSFTITLNTNQTGSFGYTITGVTSADIDGASLTGSLSNAGVLTVSVKSDQSTEGAETFTITLNNGLATTSVSISDTSVWPTSGTVISEGCVPGTYTYRKVIANGSGGSTNQDTGNSTSCGYVAPAYNLSNTISGDLSNGGGFNFYHNSTNANGTAVTVSKTGTGSSFVTISPTSFTISGTSEGKLISVTNTERAPGSAQLSVTISTSTGLSFSFTLAAVPAVQPTVSSVTFLDDPKTFYYAGETITVTVNMTSAIISGGYVKITVFFNGGNAGNNNFQSGVTRLPSTYPVFNFPIGTFSGTWPVVNGPPNLGAAANGSVYFTAVALDVNGNTLGTTKTSRTLSLRSTAPP